MAYRKLGRDNKHRRSLLASQVKNVIMYESIETTETRAKETRKFVDKMITYGKNGSLVSRRKALAFLHNDKQVVDKIFNELAPRYAKRNGRYTRILKLSERRGDDALTVILELVKDEEEKVEKKETKKTTKAKNKKEETKEEA